MLISKGSVLVLSLVCSIVSAADIPVDVAAYNPICGIDIKSQGGLVSAEWDSGEGHARLVLNLARDRRLVSSIELSPKNSTTFVPVIENADIQFRVTTGSRMPPKNPIEPYVFFDNPNSRPHETAQSVCDLQSVTVTSSGARAVMRISSIKAGPFSGVLIIQLSAGSPLIRVEAEMTPVGKSIAYFYDALVEGGTDQLAFEDYNGAMQTRKLNGDTLAPVAVRFRTALGLSARGTLAMFPPPHSFFFPRDRTDNLSTVQFDKTRFGLRQAPTGGGPFVPWFDAPEGKPQRMDFFLLPSLTNARETLDRVKRYTHDDTFVSVEGHFTFTSHFHSRLSVGQLAGKSPAREFAYVFKKMGVNIVHLGEFHGDGHIDDTGPIRLNEMKTMFELCRANSDDKLVLFPGEEGNKYLAHPWPAEKGLHPGHWMCFFPRDVYFTWVRGANVPYSETIAPYGTVYHVGNRDDMVRLLQDEKGLAWTSHPRIKASYNTPNAFKDQDFYKSAIWLGGAFKAMPGNLSDDRLGRRCFDLLDDMSNWSIIGGYPFRAMPGEVDVFEIDRNHELFGHMNINYLKLDTLPVAGNGAPVIEVLRNRDFFTTTGEIVLHRWDVKDGIMSADVAWTFPLAFAEIITGDGTHVKRQRIDLSATREFGRQRFEWRIDDAARKWTRLEIWDVARNGLYTQVK